MAFVVLFSTLSFTIDMHYCGETLVNTAVFEKAKGCGMEMQNPSTKECSVTKKDCCSDKQIFLEGQDELKINFDNFTFEQQQFVTSFIYTYINRFENFDKEAALFQEYKPPLVVRHIYKLDETYLI